MALDIAYMVSIGSSMRQAQNAQKAKAPNEHPQESWDEILFCQVFRDQIGDKVMKALEVGVPT